MELKFFVGDLIKKLQEKSNNDRPVHTYRIKSSYNYETGYEVLDQQKIEPTKDYVFTNKVPTDWINRWFKIEFVSDPSGDQVKNYGETEPTVPEILGEIIDNIKMLLGDVGEETAFTDQEYMYQIRFALKQYKGEQNILFIRDEDHVPISLLVRSQLCLTIANNHAKYFTLQAPSAQLNKGEIFEHYSNLARQLGDEYDRIVKRIGGGGINEHGYIQNLPGINIQPIKRFSKTQGIWVSDNRPILKRNIFADL